MIRTLFVAASMLMVGLAQAADNETTMKAEVKQALASVDDVKRLPATGLSFLKAGDKTFLITDNGHFVIAGNFKLVDMWQGKLLNNVADMSGVDKINLRGIGLNPDEMGAFTIGRGNQEVDIFVDPQCQYCNELLNQLDKLGETYTFKIVLIPVLGSESADIARRLTCDNDKERAMKALLSKDYKTIPPLPKAGSAGKSCDISSLQKAVVAAKLLDIKGVPFSILPSKNVFKGGSKDFKAVLEKDKDA